MTPLIPAMLGSGMIRVLLTLLTAATILSTESGTYKLLSLVGDAFFYFFPILLAGSAAKRVGVTPSLAMLVAATLLHPELASLLGEESLTFLGLSVANAVYPASILPILITVPLMKYIEDLAHRIAPSVIRIFFESFLTLLLSIPLALIIVGPLSTLAGEFLAQSVYFLELRLRPLALTLLAALMPFVLMAGFRYALLPIAVISLNSLGYDPLISVSLFCSTLAQAGACFAVALSSKQKSMKQLAIGAGISATLAGVSEPALYGITLKQRPILIVTSLSSGLAGLFAGLRGVVTYAISGYPSIFTPTQMIGNGGMDNLKNAIGTFAITFLAAFTLTLIVYKEPKTSEGDFMKQENQNPAAIPVSGKVLEKTMTLASPLTGTVIPLDQVKDETFAEGYLGEGCAIIPTDGHVYAPTNGKVMSLFDTRHAITILSDDGMEILIHVGRDTVTLGGRYFTAFCENGDNVRTGDLLLSFDLDALDKEGFDLATPMVITNNALYSSIELTANGNVTAGDPILKVSDDGKKAG